MTTLCFAGNRIGVTVDQMDAIFRVIEEYGVTELRYGDGNGSDEIARREALAKNVRVVVSPLDISACDMLLVCPYENEEQERSVTWELARSGVSLGKEVIVALPDRRVLHYNPSRESLANNKASKPGKGR